VNALGGFTGAVLLAVFALFMAFESILRMLNPVEIVFNQTIFVAVLGLVVNGASVYILVARWSYGLLGSTSAVLLDLQAPKVLRESVRKLIEADEDTRVTGFDYRRIN
jgi:Co/Zn/Cd efflux system component